MNISNVEARAAAMTAYHAYEYDPEIAKKIIFNYDHIRSTKPVKDIAILFYGIAWFFCRRIIWKYDNICFERWRIVAKKISNLNKPPIRYKEIENQDIKDYAELIERVAEIDRDAAAWMLFEAPMSKEIEFRYHKNLLYAFTWKKTPQGETVWKNLYIEITNDVIYPTSP